MILFQTKERLQQFTGSCTMVEETCVSTLAGSWKKKKKKKNLPPVFLPPVSCNGGIQCLTLFHNTSKLRRQFRFLRKSTQPPFCNNSEEMQRTWSSLQRTTAFLLHYTDLSAVMSVTKKEQRRVEDHVM